MQSQIDPGAQGQTGDRPLIAEFRAATKRYGAVLAADALSFGIGKGEFLSFLGPSGCGKTTALRMLAGFEVPTSGDVFLDGERVTDVPAYRRPVNMVFQHYALFPHMTVAQNIAYGLMQRRPRPDRAEVARKVDRALDMVRLSGFGPRRIWEMSGGQQQRVALARAIVNEPKVLLLDEPLAALDRKLRREMQIELQTLQRQLGITFVLVTHDQEEALSMSDRICIMRSGRIVQAGSPLALYDQPINRYVADFVGKSNFIDGVVSALSGEGGQIETASGYRFEGRVSGVLAPGAKASLSIRPEQIDLANSAHPGAEPVTVINRIFLGEHTEYLVRHAALGDLLVLVARQAEAAAGSFAPGAAAFVAWKPETALILPQD
ncbi:MAG: ABC transporter ATP-binding protein [Tabrizicola sp.]|uniref:ABC transporter ATP-binding protein n=1 Tax=Tabrizicola sp. TaxID=2005166 RepID=UPI002733EB51|nr:ABC transporter ATP-binding protein [Tabrizicola sp.]MDP3263457.1 ABC transporter ATP-binding protein [Tabrizicola sp.]MDP3646814.1 ABC transporter ATP-binding protein [Paracoccaceae bacterium]